MYRSRGSPFVPIAGKLQSQRDHRPFAKITIPVVHILFLASYCCSMKGLYTTMLV